MTAGKTKMTTENYFIESQIQQTVFGDKKTTTGIAIIARRLGEIYNGIKKMKGEVGLTTRHG